MRTVSPPSTVFRRVNEMGRPGGWEEGTDLPTDLLLPGSRPPRLRDLVGLTIICSQNPTLGDL